MCLGVSNIEIKKSIDKDRNDLKRSFILFDKFSQFDEEKVLNILL